ncbi:hypothetical protein MRX96_047408 [Rhipicephalus microplus]
MLLHCSERWNAPRSATAAQALVLALRDLPSRLLAHHRCSTHLTFGCHSPALFQDKENVIKMEETSAFNGVYESC